MKTPLTLLCSLALVAGQLAAKEPVVFNELKLENGTVLKAATVLRVDPDGLHISHHDGVSKVKFENLPEAVQKQFAFDREEAEKFRAEKEEAQEARNAEERREKVESIVSKQRAEQDEDLRRGREEFFALLASGEYSYPQLDKILQDSIAALKEAGREDLAATLEDDRKLLRQREVTRPAESLRKERDQLAARVRDLENQLALLNNNKPADDTHDDAVIWPIFVDRPVFVPGGVVVDHPTNPDNCPPGTRNPSRPRLTPYSPNTVVPATPSYTPGAARIPSTPVMPRTPSTPVMPRTPAQDRSQPSAPQSPRMTPQAPVSPQAPVAPQAPQFNPPQAPAAPQAPQFNPPVAPQAPHAGPQFRSSGGQVHGSHLWKKK